MRHLEPQDLAIAEVFTLLIGGIAPRPIALVATVAPNGHYNLAPFSFFNAFGANPPMIAFSPCRRVRDGTHKDTFYNLRRTRECTVQLVTYDMVEQVNLAATEYPPGVDEFVKSGLTPIPSDRIQAPRVQESPFQMECRLERLIELGQAPGSGNLMICEVIKFHVAEEIFGQRGIDPRRSDLVARNGADYYTRASGAAIFEVAKPLLTQGIGYDRLPPHMRESHVFSANNLARFGNSERIPSRQEVLDWLKSVRSRANLDPDQSLPQIFYRARRQGDYTGMFAAADRLKAARDPRAASLIESAAREALNQADLDFAWKAALYAGFDQPD